MFLMTVCVPFYMQCWTHFFFGICKYKLAALTVVIYGLWCNHMFLNKPYYDLRWFSMRMYHTKQRHISYLNLGSFCLSLFSESKGLQSSESQCSLLYYVTILGGPAPWPPSLMRQKRNKTLVLQIHNENNPLVLKLATKRSHVPNYHFRCDYMDRSLGHWSSESPSVSSIKHAW